MRRGESDDACTTGGWAEELQKPDLPHGGKRVLKLERGLYVIRERCDYGADPASRGYAERQRWGKGGREF